jgi:hypothetical protein
MRIDRYFAKLLDMPSYAAGTLEDVEERFNKNNRKRYGMHLEHIYANNDKNEALFKDKNGAFNESLFNQTRNQLGVVLLLKDAQNLSSGNDYYKKKFNTYKQSGLIWNELMVGHVGHIDLRNLNGLKITKIDPDKNGLFPLSSVPLRQKETFEVIKKLWGF